jgi:hypothetical protein
MRNPTKNREVLSRKLDNINNFTYFLMHDLRYICIYLYIWIKTFDKVELKLKALFRFKYNFILNSDVFSTQKCAIVRKMKYFFWCGFLSI